MKIKKIYLDKTESTNLFTKKNKASFNKNLLTVVSAEEQTAGYGQFGRKWVSPKGVNLYTTFYFHIPIKKREKVTSLTLLLANTIKKVLENLGFSPLLKWPNDIFVNGKKIAGVLCEVYFLEKTVEVILAFGLNVNMEKEDLLKIDKPATSLKSESGKSWNKEKILSDILKTFPEIETL